MEAELHQQRAELASIKKSESSRFRQDLISKRDLFRNFVEGVSSGIVARSAAVKASFNNFAKGFLFESCAPVLMVAAKRTVGTNGGDDPDFPAFELELSGDQLSFTGTPNWPRARCQKVSANSSIWPFEWH